MGRLWAVAILGTGWAVLLLADGTISSAAEIGLAAALGALNALVGVTLRQALWRVVGSTPTHR